MLLFFLYLGFFSYKVRKKQRFFLPLFPSLTFSHRNIFALIFCYPFCLLFLLFSPPPPAFFLFLPRVFYVCFSLQCKKEGRGKKERSTARKRRRNYEKEQQQQQLEEDNHLSIQKDALVSEMHGTSYTTRRDFLSAELKTSFSSILL